MTHIYIYCEAATPRAVIMIEAKEEVRWCSIIWQQNLHLILHNTPNVICVANDSRRRHLAVAPVYGACQLWEQVKSGAEKNSPDISWFASNRVAPLPAHPPLLRPELSGLSLSLHVVIGWREHKAQTNLGIKAKYVISFPSFSSCAAESVKPALGKCAQPKLWHSVIETSFLLAA